MWPVWGVPPTIITGKPVQSRQEYIAARQADRFFSEVRGRAVGIAELAEGHCFSAVCDAVAIMSQEVEIEKNRRAAERVKQLELEGLIHPADRAAINQAEFGLSR